MRRLAIAGLAVLMGLGAGAVVSPVRGETVLLAQSEADLKIEGDRLHEQGIEQFNTSQFREALQSWEAALKIYQRIGNRQGEAASLGNLGIAYDSLGEYQKAIAFYDQSLEIQRQIGDRQGEAGSLNSLGVVYYSLGEYQQAIAFLQQSLEITRQIGDRQGEAASLNDLGNVYYSLGEYQQAIAFQQQSLEIKRQIGDRRGEAGSLGNLGNAYFSLGEYQQAISFQQQSLEITRQIGDRGGDASSLNGLGNVYYSLGEYQKAIAFYQQSLEITRQIGDRGGEASSLGNLGNAYSYLGEYQQAIAFYDQSLEIQRQIGDRRGEAASLGSLGNVYDSLGEYQQAIAFHQQSLEIDRQIGDRQGEAASLNNLGVVFLKSGQPKEAEIFLRQGIQVQETLRQGLSDNQRISIFETQKNTYNTLQKTLIALNQPEEALTVSEWGRTRSLIEQLSVKQNITPKLPTVEDLKQTAKEQNATLVEYAVIFDEFQIEGREQVKESELYIWVIQPNGKITFRSTDLKHLWDRFSQPIPTPNRTVIQFQNFWERYINPYNLIVIYLLLPIFAISGIASIYPFIYGNPEKRPYRRSLAFSTLTLISLTGLLLTLSQSRQIVASRSATPQSQTPQTPLGQLVSQSQNSTTGQTRGRFNPLGKSQRGEEHLKELHQILIDPIADLLPTNPEASVIFIPDRDLFFVPFPALMDASGQYLIESHTISTSPSIQLLSTTRKPKPSTFQGENTLIIGNPTMPQYYDIRLERVESFDPLPHTEREAETIAKLLDSRPILGADASETAITRQMPRAKLLHFATHGLLDGFQGSIVNNNLGAIALASDPEYDPQNPLNTANDGLLTAQEIYNMQLSADLAVLSACQTGLGRVTSDGIVGLSRAFINAGVPTVLISLWNVPDAPTADLMTEFYQNLQNTPDKAQALRQAMLTIKETHPEPKDWAGFTVMGQR